MYLCLCQGLWFGKKYLEVNLIHSAKKICEHKAESSSSGLAGVISTVLQMAVLSLWYFK